jgi:hypothetical protein
LIKTHEVGSAINAARSHARTSTLSVRMRVEPWLRA